MKGGFFTRNLYFYKALFFMLVVVALQNVIAYSVNMADNIMLGAYRQEALSGAAVVNQLFFIVQQSTIAICDGLIVISAQYWGAEAHGTHPPGDRAGAPLYRGGRVGSGSGLHIFRGSDPADFYFGSGDS